MSIAEKRREEVSLQLKCCAHSRSEEHIKTNATSKVLGKVVEAAKEEDKKVSLVRQNRAKILKVFVTVKLEVIFTNMYYRIKRTPLLAAQSLPDYP